MNYRRLGSAGLKVSVLSLGAWVTYGAQVEESVASACMSAALGEGVNFFDNAEAYADGKAEVVMGNVMRKLGWRRESLVVSSKVFWGGEGPNDSGLSRKHVVEACKNSLRRLQLDYLDLYFCHRPDPNTPIEETVWAMNHLLDKGLILYWGTSMWRAEDIMKAHDVARERGLVPPQMEQPVYNMLQRDEVEREYVSLYDRIGLGVTSWSPLASGLLTGKYNDGVPPGSRASLRGYEWLRRRVINPENIETVRLLEPIARDMNCTMAQLALAWCARNENVSTVITGATSRKQVEENMRALDVVSRLDGDTLRRIEDILKERPRIELD